jgi:RNA polymerase sigma factor (sigma-70 family)
MVMSATAENDATLVAALGGDPAAIDVLLKRLTPTVRSAAQSVLRGSTYVDDAVQESLIALHRALPAFRGDCPIEAYAKRIAARTAISVRRRFRRVETREEPIPSRAEIDSPRRSPQESAAEHQRHSMMLELLDELPEEQAETFGLRAVLGLSLQEVADATGAPLNTVRSRLRLAREALVRKIQSRTAHAEAFASRMR